MCNLFIQNLTARGNGEWGMGNGGFFDSLTIWLGKKSAHRVIYTPSLPISPSPHLPTSVEFDRI